MSTHSGGAADLLTLHTDRLERLGPCIGWGGRDLGAHYLVQSAIERDVITWDRTIWGDPMFGVDAQFDAHGGTEPLEHPSSLEISYSISGDVWLSGEVKQIWPDGLDLDDYNVMDIDDQNTIKFYPDPTAEPGEFLRVIVDEFNQLHAATERMVAGWPGITGKPLTVSSRNDATEPTACPPTGPRT
ncbi:hypothetical protein ACFYVR_25165 [Rhodococcus sp. NPDC003318]|uniref:hypothetical protein n=1 Tax=Rhodococcus sp. NPDC003318 TaxID=3364503 RepID=UPI0036C2EB89